MMGSQLLQLETEIPARKFVESNEFLSVPYTVDQLKVTDKSKFSDEELAKIKAALYRFFSNVELTSSNTYQINISNGEKIGIFNTLFDAFKNNIYEINLVLQDSTKGSDKYHAPEISKEYLEQLLK